MKFIFLLFISIILFSNVNAGLTKQQKDDSLQYRKAIQAKTAKDYATAFNIFQDLANKNYAKAQYNLAIMYQLAQGVTKDEEKALSLFKKSAELGDIKAMLLMGENYYFGRGVKQNRQKAKELIGKVKDTGDKKAEHFWTRYKLDEI